MWKYEACALAREDNPCERSVEMQILKAARGTGATRQGDWDEVIRLLDDHRIHPNAIVCPDRKYSYSLSRRRNLLPKLASI